MKLFIIVLLLFCYCFGYTTKEIKDGVITKRQLIERNYDYRIYHVKIVGNGEIIKFRDTIRENRVINIHTVNGR